MKRNAFLVVAVLLLAGLVVVFGPVPGQSDGGATPIVDTMTSHGPGTTNPGSRRSELQRHDLSLPGREVIQVRVDFDPGYVAASHTHPGEEIIYVLEGLLEYQIEGQPTVTVKPGDVLFVPAGVIHSARNVGHTNGAELATYVVEKGRPLLVPAR
jgi:quercetin dioxygenase-like cupin family protein